MRNIEKLRDYFLGKDPQLKETMADNSLRLIGIEGKHFVLRTELLQRLKSLKDELTLVDEDLQNQINGVIHDLEEEIATREAEKELYVRRAGDVMTGSLSIGNTNNAPVDKLSFAQGAQNTATGQYSHAEGLETQATGPRGAHSEGWLTIASGSNSHAEGHSSTASGGCAHAEGRENVVSGINAHGEGLGTITSGAEQHTQGRYNIEDPYTYAQIIGNGANSSNRSNAHTVDWSGNAWFSGDVYVGSTSGTNKDAGSKKVATEDYVANNSVIKVLTQDIVVPEHSGLTGLESGWYSTGEHTITFFGNVEPSAFNNAIFYFGDLGDNDQYFWFVPVNVVGSENLMYASLYFDIEEAEWKFVGYGISQSLSNISTDFELPTAAAVYDFVTENCHIPEIELKYNDASTVLDDYIHQLIVVTKFTMEGDIDTTDYNGLYYVESSGRLKQIETYGANSVIYERGLMYDSVGVPNCWVRNSSQKISKSTAVSSASTDNQLSTAKAVYDLVKALADANGLTMP